MLVLSRKPGEKLQVGDNITITVLEIHGRVLRIGIEAPGDIRILRGELSQFRDPVHPAPQPERACGLSRLRRLSPADENSPTLRKHRGQRWLSQALSAGIRPSAMPQTAVTGRMRNSTISQPILHAALSPTNNDGLAG